jgi:CxxC-x17-CxxC domain-containing protein
MFEIKCSDCGKPATVPFKPTPGKPAYCKPCFSKHTYRPTENLAAGGNFNPKQAWAQRRENGLEKVDLKKSTVFRWSFATREETI